MDEQSKKETKELKRLLAEKIQTMTDDSMTARFWKTPAYVRTYVCILFHNYTVILSSVIIYRRIYRKIFNKKLYR